MKLVQATLLNPEKDRNGVSGVINVLNDSDEIKSLNPKILHPYLKPNQLKQRILNMGIRLSQDLYKKSKSEILFYTLLKLKLRMIDSHLSEETSVIHAHDPLTALYFAEKYKSKKVVLTHHYSNYPWVEYEKAGYVKNGSFVFKLLKEKLSVAMISDEINHVYVSEARKNETDKLLLPVKKANVVYNSVSIPNMDNSAKMNSNKIVNIGRIEEAKNQMELIHLMKVLSKSGVNATLDIIGDDSSVYAEKVKQLVIKENLESVVSITGPMTHFETMKKLQNATLYVHVAISESFGISLLEAMQLGKPVFAYDYPALKEIIGIENHQNQSTETGNYTKLAEKITNALTDKNALGKIAVDQKKRVDNLFTSGNMARNYLYIYLNLTNKEN